MESNSLPASNLIEIEPDRSPDIKSDHLVTSDIVQRTTCRLFVRFKTNSPPVFELNGGRKTATERELGYLAVRALERVRSLMPYQRSERIRGAGRNFRVYIATRLLLPHSDAVSGKPWTISPFGFEASRRVFKFHSDGAPGMLICHVFAQGRGEAAERLLLELVEAYQRGMDSWILRCDEDSGLCLWSQPSGRWPRAHFCEVVVAPLDRLRSGSSPIDPDIELPTIESMGTANVPDDASSLNAELDEDQDVFATFTDELHEQADRDWTFVAGEIEKAYKGGKPLDDEFVEAVAQEQFEISKTYSYPDNPDAGPSIEISRDIVRNIVDIHLLAIEQRNH